MKTTLNPIEQNIKRLRFNIYSAVARGSYSDYKKAVVAHAKESVEHFEEAKRVGQAYPKYSVPLFSGAGIRMAKIWFLNMFRKKSPKEKLLEKMSIEDRLKRKFNI